MSKADTKNQNLQVNCHDRNKIFKENIKLTRKDQIRNDIKARVRVRPVPHYIQKQPIKWLHRVTRLQRDSLPQKTFKQRKWLATEEMEEGDYKNL